MYLPRSLQPGDKIRIIAPSGTLRERELNAFEKGVEVLQRRDYQIELDPDYRVCTGYLAGTDAQRRQALKTAWNDPECRAIFCVRGGYGCMRLLENWHWTTTDPKWLVGFSDITALLWSLTVAGIPSIHGGVLTTLGTEPNWSIDRLFDCLEGKPLEPLTGEGWGGGKAQGWLLPANLSVATHILGTYLQPKLEGAILALEDVTESPYSIDRLLTQWRLMGAFQGVKGIALGRFSRCEVSPGISSWTIEEVLRDRVGDLNIPIVANLPFGHDGVNAALQAGQRVELDGDQGNLKFLSI